MRTSLNNLQEIEGFLLKRLAPPEALVFEARMIVDHDLVQQVNLQKETYAAIQQYGRRKLKVELETVHQTLFTLPKHQRFRERIMALFK
jgi:hypothetical protein